MMLTSRWKRESELGKPTEVEGRRLRGDFGGGGAESITGRTRCRAWFDARSQSHFDDGAQPTVPQIALKSRQIDTSQIGTEQGDGTFEISGMIDQVGHNAASVGPIEPVLTSSPIAPMIAKDRFLLLFARSIVHIWFSNRQPKGPFVITAAPGLRDKLFETPREPNVGHRSN